MVHSSQAERVKTCLDLKKHVFFFSLKTGVGNRNNRNIVVPVDFAHIQYKRFKKTEKIPPFVLAIARVCKV